MYEMTKVLDPDKGVSCVFRQPKAESHCRRVHGYDLRFTVTLGAHTLDANGWVYDFGKLNTLRDRIKETFDHKWVIGMDDPHGSEVIKLVEYGIVSLSILERTGCEYFAAWCAAEAADVLSASGDLGRVRVLRTTCSENGANHATYVVPYADMESGNAWQY